MSLCCNGLCEGSTSNFSCMVSVLNNRILASLVTQELSLSIYYFFKYSLASSPIKSVDIYFMHLKHQCALIVISDVLHYSVRGFIMLSLKYIYYSGALLTPA